MQGDGNTKWPPAVCPTGAQEYLAGGVGLKEAAIRHGSNPPYVRATVTLIRSKDQRLIDATMQGSITITAAAKAVEPLLLLLDGYKRASPKVRDDFFQATGCTSDLSKLLAVSSPAERTRAAETLDAEEVWSQMVVPLVAAE